MSDPSYQKAQGVPDMQNLPPYSEKQGHEKTDPLQLPHGPKPSMPYGATPSEPPPYQPYPDVGPNQAPVVQHTQTIYIAQVQPVNEPTYLGYSIFTMLCCCLPLGVAALVYSIQTRDANHFGNLEAAQRNSRMTRTFAHTALGVGLCITVIYSIFLWRMRIS